MKKLFFLVIFALVFFILGKSISSGVLNFNFYKSEGSTSISSTWNNSKSFGGHSGANEEIAFLTAPIVVVYKNKKVGDTNSQQPLIIDISDKDFGSLWFPLVKKSNFQFSVTCKHVHEMKTDSVLGQFLVNGEIFVSGHYQLIGSYSTGKATSIVVEKVLDGIYNEVRKNMN